MDKKLVMADDGESQGGGGGRNFGQIGYCILFQPLSFFVMLVEVSATQGTPPRPPWALRPNAITGTRGLAGKYKARGFMGLCPRVKNGDSGLAAGNCRRQAE